MLLGDERSNWVHSEEFRSVFSGCSGSTHFLFSPFLVFLSLATWVTVCYNASRFFFLIFCIASNPTSTNTLPTCNSSLS